MGALVAALFANIGQRVTVYDRPAAGDEANAEIENVIHGLLQQTPLPFSGQEAVSLIEARNYRDAWEELSEHDLVIECYGDSLAQKQGWLSRITPALARDSVILSLSHGDSVAEVLNALPAGFRPHFIGAHFFNPPSQQRLLELIPTERTEKRCLDEVQEALSQRLGVIPFVVDDTPNFIANRILAFAVCAAFAHAKRLNLSRGEMEALTALIIGHRDGGFCALLDQIGVDIFAEIYARITLEEHATYQSLLAEPEGLAALLQAGYCGRGVGQGYYDYQAETPIFKQALPELPPRLAVLMESGNWSELCQEGIYGEFLSAYLMDFWQYLAHISELTALSGEDLDRMLLHGFAWTRAPFALLQDFSPARVFETTSRAQQAGSIHYRLSNKWRRRQRNTDSAPVVVDEFLFKCELRAEWAFSRLYLYRGRMLVWQPMQERVGFFTPVLEELAKAISAARKKHDALMIYHHGEQFGGARFWRLKEKDLPDYRKEHEKLAEVISALRMLPYPVMISITGKVFDYGCSILMQADRVICDADVSFRMRATEYGLPPVGGMWFEWLRRMPHLSAELTRLQIHTILKKLLDNNGVNHFSAAREFGILRTHDRFVMNALQVPRVSLAVADAWLDINLSRPLRYGMHKPSAADRDYLYARSEECTQPALYRDLVDLLVAPEQPETLSLRRFLRDEAALFATRYQAALAQQAG